MRYALAITILSTLTLAAAAQDVPRVPFAVDLERRQAVEMELNAQLRAGVETRTTKGAPYSAEATTEFVQTLADGNRITRKSVTRVYRDSDGRTRRERLTAAGAPHEKQSVTISDPIAGTSIILNPEAKIAFRTAPVVAPLAKIEAERRAREVAERNQALERAKAEERSSATERAGVRRIAPSEAPAVMETKMRSAQPEIPGATTTREDLGSQTFEGVRAQGTRTTTVIAAGAIGNDQPITVVSEQWFSPDLQVLVMTRHSDPRSGETVYRLTNIVRAEPDRSLFEIPADYTVKDTPRRVPSPLRRDQ